MQKIAAKRMLLSEILSPIIVVEKEIDCDIYGLALDSRLVRPGFLFCAYRGHQDDGRNYIDIACANGAVAILCENEEGVTYVEDKIISSKKVPIFYLPRLSALIGRLAAKFYDYPARQMSVIGVTGTNGKTSITQFIAAALESEKRPCGTIGTLGMGFPGRLKPTGNTTPDIITIQSELAYFLSEGAKSSVMEVSSHRLAQGVLDDVDFKVGIFTNLSHDHLDYHRDMASYGEAKKRLFSSSHLEYAIINSDDEFGRALLYELPSSIKKIAYSVTDIEVPFPTLRAKNIILNKNGFTAQVTTPWGDGVLRGKLLGQFNVSNLLAVLAAICVVDILDKKIDFPCVAKALEAIYSLNSIPGRMQAFGGTNGKPLAIVDYAHTPDALEKVLLSLREHCHGEIWCVFGCGGERDRSKRPEMGKIAERYSDHVIITSDNPRGEDAEKIIADILEGLLCPWAVEVEDDREVAIYHAIDSAKALDFVLIAGKGHENYQIIGKERIEFSDAQKVLAALERS